MSGSAGRPFSGEDDPLSVQPHASGRTIQHPSNALGSGTVEDGERRGRRGLRLLLASFDCLGLRICIRHDGLLLLGVDRDDFCDEGRWFVLASAFRLGESYMDKWIESVPTRAKLVGIEKAPHRLRHRSIARKAACLESMKYGPTILRFAKKVGARDPNVPLVDEIKRCVALDSVSEGLVQYV
jgi:hypothetical protein